MNPRSAIVAALLLVVGALSLIAVSTTAVSPRPAIVPESRREPDRQEVRGTQREERRVAERRVTPAPAEPAAEAPVAPPEAVVAPPEAVAVEAAQPEEATVAPAAPPPADVVTSYYRALDARRFEGAWNSLSPAVQAAFGGFERWRTGYATTLASRPRDIAVERDGSVATIAHELVTEDRSSCGPVRRRFAVRWRLVLGTSGWRAASLTGVKRSGPEPDAACTARHDAGRGAGGR